MALLKHPSVPALEFKTNKSKKKNTPMSCNIVVCAMYACPKQLACPFPLEFTYNRASIFQAKSHAFS